MTDQARPQTLPATPEALSAQARAEIDALAQRHRRAGGLLIRLVNLAGGQLENRLELLPDRIKDQIETAARNALGFAYRVAERSHQNPAPGRAPALGNRGNLALATVTGAVGGFGGLPSSLAELPVTTTLLLRAIQTIAQGHGFDLSEARVRAECLQVFASGSPLEADDGVNTSFLTARVTLTGGAMQRLISAVAPRFAAVFGQKLAAQAVPILGAVAGAGVNYTFASYYQEMAHIRFGLMRLADQHDPDAVAAAFRVAASPPALNRA